MSNYFVEKLKVPSAAIQAMVDGLREIPDETFRVDMWTFGDSNNGVCYGCAATCAVQQIEQKRYLPIDLNGGTRGRSRAFSCDPYDLQEFEIAINALRCGSLENLALLFGVHIPFEESLPRLDTPNYMYHLDTYEAYANKLREIGL